MKYRLTGKISTLQISDFGLSRDLQDETYYVSKGGQLPIKWTAPEVIKIQLYIDYRPLSISHVDSLIVDQQSFYRLYFTRSFQLLVMFGALVF